jgi:predicted Holliday junction resolvase-like endonuclease
MGSSSLGILTVILIVLACLSLVLFCSVKVIKALRQDTEEDDIQKQPKGAIFSNSKRLQSTRQRAKSNISSRAKSAEYEKKVKNFREISRRISSSGGTKKENQK